VRRKLLLAVTCLALVPGPALAQYYGDCWAVVRPLAPREVTAGINLALTDCSATGTQVADTRCDANLGVAVPLVLSASPPPGLDRVVGIEAAIDAVTAGATLSPWWTLDGCRSNALVFNFDFTALENPLCNDFWAGQATGGGGISPLHFAPNRFRIRLAAATAYETPMAAGVEHYLAKVNILRAKSTGAGNCAGCEDGACLVLSTVLLSQPAGLGDCMLTWPINQVIVQYGDGAIVAAQNRTWGQVKALYR
jgi:hypothetical protein